MSLSSDSLIESTTHCSNSLRPFDLVRERKFTDLKKTNWLSTLKFLQSFKLTSVLWMGSLAGSSACNQPAFESGLLRPGRNQSGQWSPALQPSPSVKSQMRYKSSKLVGSSRSGTFSAMEERRSLSGSSENSSKVSFGPRQYGAS